jgi:prephenate dehydratase/chorismate mutase/prephenate dehydratase
MNERFELGLITKKLKGNIRDKRRKAQILNQLKQYSKVYSVIQSGFIEKIYSSILKESRSIQKSNRKLIGFQGEHGAFSEIAANHFNKNLVTLPYTGFADVIEEVEKEHLDMGIVPVENSLGGAITEVNELLVKTELKIIGEIKLRINQCLLKLTETHYRDIRIVYSHPQALSQCRSFLNRHQLEAKPFYDTAGSAKMLIKEKPKTAAVIANPLCADIYNLDVIKENVQDHSGNFTRFLVLAPEEQKKTANKCSIIFSTSHRAGALFEVLQIFTDNHINLTRIESLPNREDPGSYVFFLDFQSNSIHNNIPKILSRIEKKTVMLKYLGCYSEEVVE